MTGCACVMVIEKIISNERITIVRYVFMVELIDIGKREFVVRVRPNVDWATPSYQDS